jgi:response regulator RpfG family c-di-GMP phosphodiesterase
VLAAFFLGRYRAGVLALFCVVSATMVTALDLSDFGAFTSPVIIALAITVWGAVLGLNALLVGTLSDERAEKINELHDAYVGVVEVLSRYLSSADPKAKGRAPRVSQLCQKVAARMKLTEEEIDDIRVASLLQDVENVEVTARVIRKAMDEICGTGRAGPTEHTFQGSELVHSLGSVLAGAFPLILLERNQGLDLDRVDESLAGDYSPLGLRVIQTVRRYDALANQGSKPLSPREAIRALHEAVEEEHHPAVVHALESVVLASGNSAARNDEEEEAAALASCAAD